MKQKILNYSFFTCLLLAVVSFSYRYYYSVEKGRYQVTTWDALGYYLFLPGAFIYDDIDKLDWFDEKEIQYQLSAGDRYQYRELPNKNRVGKYFLGVSFMEFPFFMTGHLIAKGTNYQADGFSKPYQYSIAFGVIVYFSLALFILRKVLLRFYDGKVTSISLLILVLGTNLLQYISIDSAMSHSFLFLLYSLILFFTIKWHEKPTRLMASLIGFTVGLSVLCRPTEALMVFIPIFWGIHNNESWKAKKELILKHRSHLIFSLIFGFLIILPQLFYWKYVTGSIVYDVGSKWQFLNPWFRVIIGFQKGWIIYTPLTILFLIGLFLIKSKPFRFAVLVFSILNIWLVISWHEWTYGASYSTRALVQSYPVMTLALAAVIERLIQHKYKWMLLPVLLLLIYVNLFQIWQYNEGILLCDGMSLDYYQSVFLKTEIPH